jgi:transcriptional regulator with XRE-family HTH domain
VAEPQTAPDGALMRNMRTLRQARGWSCTELAHRLTAAGFSTKRSGLANIEAGRYQTLSVGFLFALAEVFGVEPWVLTDTASICVTCAGMPPHGYACLACGRAAPQAAVAEDHREDHMTGR